MAIAKIVKLRRSAQITLPKKARQALGVIPGDRIAVVVRDGEVVLTPIREAAKRSCGLLRGTWGSSAAEVDRYLRGERKSWEQTPADS